MNHKHCIIIGLLISCHSYGQEALSPEAMQQNLEQILQNIQPPNPQDVVQKLLTIPTGERMKSILIMPFIFLSSIMLQYKNLHDTILTISPNTSVIKSMNTMLLQSNDIYAAHVEALNDSEAEKYILAKFEDLSLLELKLMLHIIEKTFESAQHVELTLPEALHDYAQKVSELVNKAIAKLETHSTSD